MAAHNLNFLEFLSSFRRGALIAEADDVLGDLMTAIKETGGKGTLTITLPFKVNNAGQVECDPTIACKKPVTPLGTGIYYVDEDGGLTRRDPNQDDMFDDLAARRGATD